MVNENSENQPMPITQTPSTPKEKPISFGFSVFIHLEARKVLIPPGYDKPERINYFSKE